MSEGAPTSTLLLDISRFLRTVGTLYSQYQFWSRSLWSPEKGDPELENVDQGKYALRKEHVFTVLKKSNLLSKPCGKYRAPTWSERGCTLMISANEIDVKRASITLEASEHESIDRPSTVRRTSSSSDREAASTSSRPLEELRAPGSSSSSKAARVLRTG